MKILDQEKARHENDEEDINIRRKPNHTSVIYPSAEKWAQFSMSWWLITEEKRVNWKQKIICPSTWFVFNISNPKLLIKDKAAWKTYYLPLKKLWSNPLFNSLTKPSTMPSSTLETRWWTSKIKGTQQYPSRSCHDQMCYVFWYLTLIQHINEVRNTNNMSHPSYLWSTYHYIRNI